MDDWLTLRARTHADRPALVAGGRVISYAELEARAAATARRLAAVGVRSGDRVATTLGAGPEFVELVHSLPKLGAVLVPLNTRLTTGERRLQLADVDVRLLVEEGLAGEEADAVLSRTVEPGATQTLLFTSGTSARPKPVELTYGNHAAAAIASAWNLGVAPDDRWLCVLPLFHVGGLAIVLRSAVYGTTVVLHERFDEGAVAGALGDGAVTLVSLVPTMLRRLRDAGFTRAPRLRAALLGGGPIPPDLIEWARDRKLPVVPTYGMTETASQVATVAPDEASSARAAAARPLPGVGVRIARDGEILVRGPMVAPGAIAHDGWLHTGDTGHLDDDGRLRVEGRLKDVIVTGGENVSPAEVEDALSVHPAVADAGVVGSPDSRWGEAVSAFVVLRAPATEAELIAHCRQRLAPYKVPKRVEQVGGLPRNAAGKLLRDQIVR